MEETNNDKLSVIEEHFEEEEDYICSSCNVETNEKYFLEYDGKCERCHIKENPQLNIGIGRNCDKCNDELQMYKWCRIYGNDGGEYCMDCFNQLQEDEE
jgi:hypothetical protein